MMGTPLVGGEEKVMAGDQFRVSFARMSWLDTLRLQFVHVGTVILVFTLASVVLFCDDSAPRMWIVAGFFTYLSSRSWESIVHLSDVLVSQHYLEVTIHSNRNRTLFTALTNMLVDAGSQDCRSCSAVSRDCDSDMETDYVTGKRTVRFGFWGRRTRRETVVFADAHGKEHKVAIHYQRGDVVICGRESMPMSQHILTLTMRSTEAELQRNHEALRAFCQTAYDKHMKCETGVVDVYFPYESSREWAPEWKRERSIQFAPEAAGKLGLDYHLTRGTFADILHDAQLWRQSKLRVYIIHGQAGVGKSHFVTRLAHTTGLPIYRARLTGLSISDASLQQLFSANVLQHDAVLVHFDEFQCILESWRSQRASDLDPSEPSPAKRPRIHNTAAVQSRTTQISCSITEEGFNEFLQSGSSMQKGIVVLSGSQKLKDVAEEFPALFRRAACVCQVDPLSHEEVSLYVRNFMSAFLTLRDASWATWMQKFSAMDIGAYVWSIDALQQYLMKTVAEVGRKSMMMQTGPDSTNWIARPGCEDQIMTTLVNATACVSFLEGYAVKY